MLAVPAAVWGGAGFDQLFGSCGPTGCGDRDRGWFVLVLVTAPLIPLGSFMVARGLRPGALAGAGRWACLLACGVFVLLGLALVGVGIGALVDYVEGKYPVNLDDPAGSKHQALFEVGLWGMAALWCFAVAFALLRVRRRLLSRRIEAAAS